MRLLFVFRTRNSTADARVETSYFYVLETLLFNISLRFLVEIRLYREGYALNLVSEISSFQLLV
jgi:hypothetical protein